MDADIQARNNANRRAIADNRRAFALLDEKKRLAEVGKGLKAMRDSGLSREKVIEMVNAVFDEAGLA